MNIVIESKSWTPPANEERATPFECRVWDVLRTVRVGGVVTYAALARRVGAPNSVSAVANACAKSAIAVAISGDRFVRTARAAPLSKQEPEFDSLLRSVSPGLDRRTVILTLLNGESRM